MRRDHRLSSETANCIQYHVAHDAARPCGRPVIWYESRRDTGRPVRADRAGVRRLFTVRLDAEGNGGKGV